MLLCDLIEAIFLKEEIMKEFPCVGRKNEIACIINRILIEAYKNSPNCRPSKNKGVDVMIRCMQDFSIRGKWVPSIYG
jgi:hypothetical protein